MDTPPPPPPPPPTPGAPYYQQPPPQPPRGWWKRNCLWFVPAGCLSLLLLFAAFGFGIMMFVMGAIKSSDAYKTGLQRAASNQQVIDALGSPVEGGMFVSGNINVSGPGGNATLSTPVSGPKGSGKLFITAQKAEGVWTYSTLNVHVDKTDQVIDLRPAAP